MSNLGWHFIGKTLRDGRPIPRDGEWLEHEGPIIICSTGLHGSRRPWHALRYAPGDVLCRVEFDGIVDEHDDKLVARRRRILCRAEFSETLRYFARMQALSVAHLRDAPEVVLDHLMTGDERIRAAARAAAWDAAWDAAWAAARDAAMGAACAAVSAAAWAAARDTAWDAAWDTAWDAAWDTAWDAAGREFDSLVYEQFGMGGSDAE